jgi:hypothetical protein
MRKLIIALPRTGSSSLLDTISKRDSLKLIFEPFDGTNRFPYDESEDNIVVKTMVFQFPKGVKPINSWLKTFSRQFDETILLSRRNFKELCESYAYFIHNQKDGFTSNTQYVWYPTPNYNVIEYRMKEWVDDINSLSLDLNIPITYYEDIYDMNDPNKLRKYKNNNSITKII